jgi:hypothetical protein
MKCGRWMESKRVAVAFDVPNWVGYKDGNEIMRDVNLTSGSCGPLKCHSRFESTVGVDYGGSVRESVLISRSRVIRTSIA